jgi:hypothetical protein
MKSRFFHLDGHTPVRCEPEDWKPRIGTEEWRVKFSEQGDVQVSTIFLGIDHRFVGNGPPLLFETLLRVAGESHDMVRYSSWDDAVTGHDALARRAFAVEGAKK